MGLEVFYPQDIRNALLAAEQASAAALQAASREDAIAGAYQEGYRAALTTIALAFGLIQPDGHGGNRGWQPMFLSANARGVEPNALARPPPCSQRFNPAEHG